MPEIITLNLDSELLRQQALEYKREEERKEQRRRDNEHVIGRNRAGVVKVPLTPDQFAEQTLRREIRLQAPSKAEKILQKMEKHALVAVDRMHELNNRDDEPEVAFKAGQFLIEHVIGKPVQRNENRNMNVNVDVLAD